MIATDIPSGSDGDGRFKMRWMWGKCGEVDGRELGAMGADGSGQRRSHHGPRDIQRSGDKNASRGALGAEADALGTAVRVFTGLSSSNNVRLTQTINAST